MKKTLFILVLLTFSLMFLSAEGIDMGDFPVGTWLDPNYDAVWELSVENIRILDTSGNVYFDFSEATVEDFDVSGGMSGLTVSFSCPETGKFYKLTKPVSMGTAIVLEIERSDYPDYRVEMPFRK
ncbi:hypothetical protein [Marispirochaeta aestuarii]|uniref:hypothetical protein n=1 Tax=Marispirochaeta aestuarii TaxID=1963862 RepID=UPI0029C9B02B|nr:hypothetical protein [Marispirochaeta aestuarii]